MKTLVYLAGPMTGYPDSNRPAFNDAAFILRQNKTYEVCNPAELDIDRPLPANAPVSAYYRRDMEYLRQADLVIVLPGWQQSLGATYEVATAYNVFKMPVLRFPDLRKLSKIEIPQLVI